MILGQLAVSPSGDLIAQNGYLLLNNLCGLAGYYAAAFVIDNPKVGRKNLQMCSFLLMAVLFLVTGGMFNTGGPGLLMFLYFTSSFVCNWSNTTSYVMAAETYPTELRATLHGSEFYYTILHLPLLRLTLTFSIYHCNVNNAGSQPITTLWIGLQWLQSLRSWARLVLCSQQLFSNS